MIIEIPLRAVAKQRARTVNGHTYTPPQTRQFEEAVAWQVRAQTKGKAMAGDLKVKITMASRTKLRGDTDNYAKAILDGLVKGGAIEDDRQIVDLHTIKREGEYDIIWVEVEQA